MSNLCADVYKSKKTAETLLKPVNTGEEICAPGHFWGPGVRAHYLIHYVISGRGVLYCGQKKYVLKTGQMFVIFPNTIVKYQADTENPWHYIWTVFGGDEAKEIFAYLDISPKNPVLTPCDSEKIVNIMRSMPRERGTNMYDNLRFSSLLYELMANLVNTTADDTDRENAYLTSATRYIRAHYQSDMTVERLASYIGISRKYLFAIFKNSLGVSPKDYIVDYRMKKAAGLLSDKNLTVSNVAYSVGYKDALTFSRMFKTKFGVSPTDYRNKI